MDLLKGKTAIITGAARGIGKHIALAYAKEGANVAFTDIRMDENMTSLQEELEKIGVKAKGYPSDASNFKETEDTVNQIASDFGKIDILVNNAGITRDTLLMRMDEEAWDLVIKKCRAVKLFRFQGRDYRLYKIGCERSGFQGNPQ